MKKSNSICDRFPRNTSIYSNCRWVEYLYKSIRSQRSTAKIDGK